MQMLSRYDLDTMSAECWQGKTVCIRWGPAGVCLHPGVGGEHGGLPAGGRGPGGLPLHGQEAGQGAQPAGNR